MKHQLKLSLILLGMGILIAGCGGGGGGGASSSSKPRTGARVLQGSIEASPIALGVPGSPDSVIGKFSIPSSYVSLSPGPQSLEVRRAASSQVLFVKQIEVVQGNRYDILLYGDLGGLGLATAVLSSDIPAVPDGSAAIRIIHSLVGARALESRVSSTTISGTTFGAASEYVTVPAGVVEVESVRATDGQQVYVSEQTLLEGEAYSLLLAGEIGYLVVGRLIEE